MAGTEQRRAVQLGSRQGPVLMRRVQGSLGHTRSLTPFLHQQVPEVSPGLQHSLSSMDSIISLFTDLTAIVLVHCRLRLEHVIKERNISEAAYYYCLLL